MLVSFFLCFYLSVCLSSLLSFVLSFYGPFCPLFCMSMCIFQSAVLAFLPSLCLSSLLSYSSSFFRGLHPRNPGLIAQKKECLLDIMILLHSPPDNPLMVKSIKGPCFERCPWRKFSEVVPKVILLFADYIAAPKLLGVPKWDANFGNYPVDFSNLSFDVLRPCCRVRDRPARCAGNSRISQVNKAGTDIDPRFPKSGVSFWVGPYNKDCTHRTPCSAVRCRRKLSRTASGRVSPGTAETRPPWGVHLGAVDCRWLLAP